MTEFEPLVRSELERLVPLPDAGRSDWSDVLRRAGVRRSPARRLALVLAAALAVLVAAAALARSVGGFEAWLRGTPGKPASEKAQQRFQAANGRSWGAFPTGTKLRELIRTTTAGREYVLYGFQSGDSLCVKLAAAGIARQPQVCAPKSAVARTSAPIVAALGDYTFFDRAARPLAQASFGIAADGVARVSVEATDGVHRALVGGNAYLFLEAEPNTANRVFAISAVDARRRKTRVRLPAWTWALSTDRLPGGPTRVQAHIENPKVGWYVRGEKRGFPAYGDVRFVKPDPLSDLAVGLSGNLCLVALDAGRYSGESCGHLFDRAPINRLISCQTCGEFLDVRGVAADGVERVVIFLADGSRLPVPLRHNLFAARVGRQQLPMRIVGYDTRGRVVATQLWRMGQGVRVPAAAEHLSPVLRRAGPNGTRARLLVGPIVRSYGCWRVEFSSGQKRGACTLLPYTGPSLRVDLVQPAGRDLFVVGQVSDRVARVELRFSSGERLATKPVAGHFLLAVPRDQLSRRRHRAFVVTFDAHNLRHGRQRIFYSVR